MDNSYKRLSLRRWLVIGLLIVLGLAAFFVTIPNNNLSTGIIIESVPKDAKVVINNKTYKTGSIPLEPGVHNVRIEKMGFETESFDVSVDSSDYRRTYHIALGAVSDSAVRWAQRNLHLYRALEELAGMEANNVGEKQRMENPIIAVLPYRGVLYNIDYRLADENSSRIIVQISAETPDNRSLALERIRAFGYEPTDYEVEFLGVSNSLFKE